MMECVCYVHVGQVPPHDVFAFILHIWTNEIVTQIEKHSKLGWHEKEKCGNKWKMKMKIQVTHDNDTIRYGTRMKHK